MNLIEAMKQRKKCTLIHKPYHFFEAYDFHFSRKKDIKTLLEIGVSGGGSLWTWKKYFAGAKIYGIDINEKCKQYEGPDVKIFIGNQADLGFLRQVVKDSGGFDIIIDDGSHVSSQQILSFNYLFPFLNNDGIYVFEDIGTSYWEEFGGGFSSKSNLINYLKTLADVPSLWAAREPQSRERNNVMPNKYEQIISSIHFYNQMCFIYKKGHGHSSAINLNDLEMCYDFNGEEK